MTDWNKHWNTFPKQAAAGDYLKQVGKTVNGAPISAEQVENLVEDILAHLQIVPEDRLLDLCCGNGIITQQCARHCRSIVGADYSNPLIQIASTNFSGPNIHYHFADVCDLPSTITSQAFDKIYMYEALQHLGASQVVKLLRALRSSASSKAPVLLASVPDEERLWSYYNTPARKEEYFRRKAEGNEALGHWWTSSAVTAVAAESGYLTEIVPQNKNLHTAHYRFDALLRPSA